MFFYSKKYIYIYIYILLMFQNTNYEKEVIFLMISNEEGWHYLAVKKLLALLREIVYKYHGDFYCLNCLHLFATESKLESHKKERENEDSCNVVMPSEDTEILKFNQYQKCDKVSFIIYVDLECLIEKIDGCKNNPQNSSGFTISTISFKSIENKHDAYRSKYCV